MQKLLTLGLILALAATSSCDRLTNPRTATNGDVTSNATLTGLTVSSGTLSPTFAPGTTSYSLPVTNDITSITITPTAALADQVVTVNGGLVATGSASPAISLPIGTSFIIVRVASADGATTQSYTIAVNRAP